VNVNAYDANTGNASQSNTSRYLFSARLGDAIVKTPVKDESPRCWQQSLRYTMTIDSSNALLIMKFALVLQYIPSHSVEAEPRFRLTLYDQNGNIIPDCANYDVYASNIDVNGFQLYTPSGSSPRFNGETEQRLGRTFCPITGKTLTIEFYDC